VSQDKIAPVIRMVLPVRFMGLLSSMKHDNGLV
jgi:hypothetical protein